MREELPEKYFYNRNKVVRIGQVLKGVIPKKNTIEERNYQKIVSVWKEIVGEKVCRSTKVTGIKNRIMYVTVESSAMIHYLTNFERHAIICKINNIMGIKYVEDIRFRTGITDSYGRK